MTLPKKEMHVKKEKRCDNCKWHITSPHRQIGNPVYICIYTPMIGGHVNTVPNWMWCRVHEFEEEGDSDEYPPN